MPLPCLLENSGEGLAEELFYVRLYGRPRHKTGLLGHGNLHGTVLYLVGTFDSRPLKASRVLIPSKGCTVLFCYLLGLFRQRLGVLVCTYAEGMRFFFCHT